ncbi:protein kinase C and casein kinase substrate in neurons protein 1-like isoform X2 [Dreissena polymorpha]|uniref:protein kinase C and casein kinase substrate in neurons protein 1-like isoform X2 n=2 Tax=Dreissena polymorpha TaxID=45954 RepID=UPI002263D431|nr:protein kinase C and casein kinase substrate in neurons protein 1-like isoform X2 [Dreissena polymorpha]
MPCFECCGCCGRRVKSSRVSNQSASEAVGPVVDMSINNGEDVIQATSESFWEVGKFVRTVKRVDNGYSLCSSLKQLINTRAEIERSYSKQLTSWSKKWNEFLDKGTEYGTTQGAWRGVLEEANKVANLHTDMADKLVNNVIVSIKQWQKESYHKSMMHFKETKEFEDGFRKVQKPWEKKLNKVLTAKKDFHNACRNEKSTANQENNARADTAMSSDQLKKLQDKLKKCQADVETTQAKYTASLNDLNGYNAKYVEEMTEVFNSCQEFERRRIEFIKKTMFDIHQCLDLSVDTNYSQVYTDLHHTISSTDSEKDLRWWSNTHGADMPMNWPVFEEYSPDLKPIHGKEKKMTSTEGITITSIRQNPDNFVPSSNQRGNRDSQLSQKSQSSNNNPAYSNSVPQPSPPQVKASSQSVSQQPTARQISYDDSLNPFGGENPSPTAESSISNANTSNSENQSSVANPFGDGDDEDEQVSNSGSGVGSETMGSVMSVPARVVYDYKAEEDDEISAEAGEVITRLSEQDDMGWVKARTKDGREGLIPYGYVEDIE